MSFWPQKEPERRITTPNANSPYTQSQIKQPDTREARQHAPIPGTGPGPLTPGAVPMSQGPTTPGAAATSMPVQRTSSLAPTAPGTGMKVAAGTPKAKDTSKDETLFDSFLRACCGCCFKKKPVKPANPSAKPASANPRQQAPKPTTPGAPPTYGPLMQGAPPVAAATDYSANQHELMTPSRVQSTAHIPRQRSNVGIEVPPSYRGNDGGDTLREMTPNAFFNQNVHHQQLTVGSGERGSDPTRVTLSDRTKQIAPEPVKESNTQISSDYENLSNFGF